MERSRTEDGDHTRRPSCEENDTSGCQLGAAARQRWMMTRWNTLLKLIGWVAAGVALLAVLAQASIMTYQLLHTRYSAFDSVIIIVGTAVVVTVSVWVILREKGMPDIDDDDGVDNVC